MLIVLLLREGHLPVGLGCVALLFRDKILLRQRVVTLKVEARANFIGGGALDLGLRSGYVFLPVAVDPQLIIGLGLRGGGTRSGDVLRAISALCLFGRSPGLIERGQQFLVIERDQNLAGLHRIAFSDEHFIDAPANFRADANIARFNGARALQPGVATKPCGIDGCGAQHHRDQNQDDDAFPAHKINLHP